VPGELLQTLGFALLICILNYISSSKSNLAVAKTIMIDSVTDLILPLLSILSIQMPKLDSILAQIQLIIICAISIFFVAAKLKSNPETEKNSLLGFVTMLISTIITYYCMGLTNEIATTANNLSVAATCTHFRVDLVAKLSMLAISITNLFKFRRRKFVVMVLDILAMLGVLLISVGNLTMFYWRLS
jgi:divalent metal cation (Fe/Co/Zn/Cd) transporter